MKKSLLVLLLAVLFPSLVLGWLALRSAEEQQIVLERRTAELYQTETDRLAAAARGLVEEERRLFAETLREMLAQEPPRALAARFTTALRDHWSRRAVGFALQGDGRLLSPSQRDTDEQSRRFLQDNGGFLSNRSAETVYALSAEEMKSQDYFQRAPSTKSNASQGAPKKAEQQSDKLTRRSIEPATNANAAPESQLTWATAEFRDFTTGDNEGVLNRFVQDRLNMIFWVRPPKAEGLIFGCLFRGEDLLALWPSLLPEPAPQERSGETPARSEYILALLDDQARPMATAPEGAAVADWKKPFVATEIGEALPHWEATLYLRDPGQLRASARLVRRNLYLLISCALAAIAVGGAVVLAVTRQQLRLAQKKTDFVSNVSHELKTPLTSIRMFAEMMHEGRAPAERQGQYLRIIMVEAERLTRLINNVLDFARVERGQKPLEKKRLDFHETLERLWSAQELHLREAGFTPLRECAGAPYPIVGDEDALAQVLVNLLSNAEKYGGDAREVTLKSTRDGAWLCVSVLDRGAGVPPGEETKIFAPFYRAHDSLASGIPGSGLGLSLSQRIVREHGGEIRYQPRPGGGSDFTMRLPLALS